MIRLRVGGDTMLLVSLSVLMTKVGCKGACFERSPPSLQTPSSLFKIYSNSLNQDLDILFSVRVSDDNNICTHNA